MHAGAQGVAAVGEGHEPVRRVGGRAQALDLLEEPAQGGATGEDLCVAVVHGLATGGETRCGGAFCAGGEADGFCGVVRCCEGKGGKDGPLVVLGCV